MKKTKRRFLVAVATCGMAVAVSSATAGATEACVSRFVHKSVGAAGQTVTVSASAEACVSAGSE